MSKKIANIHNPPVKTIVSAKYHPGGEIMSEVPYVDGKKHGVETGWHDKHANGNKFQETIWVNNKRHGVTTRWHRDGSKRWQGMWVGGKQRGMETSWWNKNGMKSEESSWANNKRHGMTTEWYRNGAKSRQAMWRGGKQHGVDTTWHDNGQKKWETYFILGKKHTFIRWDEKGNATRVNIPLRKQPTTPTINHPQDSKHLNQTTEIK